MGLISYHNAYHNPDDKLIEICSIFQNSIDHAALLLISLLAQVSQLYQMFLSKRNLFLVSVLPV